MNLKIPETIFCSYPFQILRILKTPCFILISINTKIVLQIILIKLIIQIDRLKAKYIITACISINIIKIFLLFFLLYIRMNRKNINFDNKNIKKSDFYNKDKKNI